MDKLIDQKSYQKKLLLNLKVGSFLARREVRRSNPWTTILIIFVMTLTFLNLVVVSGILVGLIEGSEEANRERYTSDVILSPLPEREYIRDSTRIEKEIKKAPGYAMSTSRYVLSGTVVSNYKDTLRKDEKNNISGGSIVGINPELEDQITHISETVIEGEYLTSSDSDKIMIGKDLLYQYTPIDSPGFSVLKDVGVGSRVLVRVGDSEREMFVKGILKSKAGEVDARIFMTASEARKLGGRSDLNVDEIAVELAPGYSVEAFRDYLLEKGFGDNARIQTWEDAQPKFLKDIKTTFALLGNMISSIGLVVASITIFIVIFVNAITRRRYIGILKGVGVTKGAIEISYVLQALFYAISGVLIGTLLVFLVLKPAIYANPIDFPFSDGILVATALGTFFRAVILFLATLVAGYIPAYIVIKQNTLDAILGR
ncbi:MAG: ABC transporter permease [Candidatus Nomurabacteria bacterium]|nr:MAG: ABC transporter permease [Candidatus Nomurabacteria bacterium]